MGNTIQVAAYSKRREVAVMKLVGASNWFIQAPFVLEAVVAGLIGSILGFIFLFVGKVVLLDGRLQALTNVLTPDPERQRVADAAAAGRGRRRGQRDHRVDHAALLPQGLSPYRILRTISRPMADFGY